MGQWADPLHPTTVGVLGHYPQSYEPGGFLLASGAYSSLQRSGPTLGDLDDDPTISCNTRTILLDYKFLGAAEIYVVDLERTYLCSTSLGQ